MKRGAEAQREKDELEAAARGDVLAPRKRAAVSYAAPAPNQEEKQPEVEVVRVEFHKRDQEVGNEPEYGAPPKTKRKKIRRKKPPPPPSVNKAKDGVVLDKRGGDLKAKGGGVVKVDLGKYVLRPVVGQELAEYNKRLDHIPALAENDVWKCRLSHSCGSEFHEIKSSTGNLCQEETRSSSRHLVSLWQGCYSE